MVANRARKKAARQAAEARNLSYMQYLQSEAAESKDETAHMHLVYGLTAAGKTTAAEKLQSLTPGSRILDERELHKAIQGETYYVTLHADDDREKAVEQLKQLISHANPNLRYSISSTTLCYRYKRTSKKSMFSSSREWNFRAIPTLPPSKKRNVYAVVSPIGGIGKTLYSDMICDALAEEGKKTVYADVDFRYSENLNSNIKLFEEYPIILPDYQRFGKESYVPVSSLTYPDWESEAPLIRELINYLSATSDAVILDTSSHLPSTEMTAHYADKIFFLCDKHRGLEIWDTIASLPGVFPIETQGLTKEQVLELMMGEIL